MVIRPLHTLLPIEPRAMARARSCMGKISDIKTQQMGPILIEKKTTSPQKERIARAAPLWPLKWRERLTRATNRRIVIPILLAYNEGFLTSLSIRINYKE
ncbi:hypothetical protein MLD38_015806 [Melastoma candidum]|uniref:Uncharacterized protein n=1 Tax=Melastoma candidum TaxID=119954 RepID=A0ACB9RHH1_9MYRT|nr:hypothetical protein MLD38_015806 [Melastoma candidum]